jgi:hypothetical protein
MAAAMGIELLTEETISGIAETWKVRYENIGLVNISFLIIIFILSVFRFN